MLLFGSAVAFGVFAWTGEQRYKILGLRVLRWTLAAAFAFFAVMILDRLFG
ncbi:MAG: hypothetical protein V4731_04285 [Pseudomonadota bacterium]